MAEFTEILKYTLPSVVVLLSTVLTLRLYLKNEEKRRKFEISLNQKDNILPLRLQAYERFILFLERISPDALVMRLKKKNFSVIQMQNEMINIIRTEFDHNLSQQTYISNEAWENIKTARSDTINLINRSASEFKPEDPGIELSKRILENAMELPNSPANQAIQFVKKEVRLLF